MRIAEIHRLTPFRVPFGLDAEGEGPPTTYQDDDLQPAPPSIQGISILGGWTTPDGIPSGGGGGYSNASGGIVGGYTVTGGVEGIVLTLLPPPTSFLGGDLRFQPGEIANLSRSPITSLSFAYGPGFGIQVTLTWDTHGQTFVSVGGQIGKSWPFSASLTDNWLVGNPDPTATEIAAGLNGLGWSGGAGYYFGGQLAGPADWSIFNPIYNPFNPGGAGPANLWGVGLMTPQAGFGLGYTFQGPTLATPLPPHHISKDR